MIGTLVNTAAILVGSTVGSLVKKGLKEKYQDVLYVAMGLAATGLGIHAVVTNMTESIYPVLFIISLAIGGLIGTFVDLDGKFKRLVDRNQESSAAKKTAAKAAKLSSGKNIEPNTPAHDTENSNFASSASASAATSNTISDTSNSTKNPTSASETAVSTESKKPRLSEGLSTAIMLFCIGTLSILGPIQSALYQNETYLLTNAALDLVTSLVLASTYGIGIAFSAGVLFAWQGSIYLLANQLAPFLTAEMMTEVSIVGGFLILASGLSILNIKSIKTLNLLPALLVPIAWIVIVSLIP